MASAAGRGSGNGVIQLIDAPDASNMPISEQKSHGMRINFSEAEVKDLEEAYKHGSIIELSFGKTPVRAYFSMTNATSC